MTSQGSQCLVYLRGQIETPGKERFKTYSSWGASQHSQPEGPLASSKLSNTWGLGRWNRGRERESRGTLCKPRSYCVTGAVPIGHRLAAELDHLMQPKLPAVDGGSLGLQSNDELLRVLGGGQACLEDRDRSWDLGLPGQICSEDTVPCLEVETLKGGAE